MILLLRGFLLGVYHQPIATVGVVGSGVTVEHLIILHLNNDGMWIYKFLDKGRIYKFLPFLEEVVGQLLPYPSEFLKKYQHNTIQYLTKAAILSSR